MVDEARALNTTLSAAAGGDAVLFSDLRQAFIDSLDRQLNLLRRSRCDANWQITAQRIKGLAASFLAEPLILLADHALESAPGDPRAIRQIQAWLDAYQCHEGKVGLPIRKRAAWHRSCKRLG